MQPLRDNVLIKMDAAEKVSRGGIVIPDIAKDRATFIGTVVAIGREVVDLIVGDKVVIGKFTGNEIDSKQIIIKEEDVLAKEA